KVKLEDMLVLALNL
ncbi:unnamed protein product, partial [Rotaria socialis]